MALLGKESLDRKACENLPGVEMKLNVKSEVDAFRNERNARVDRQTDRQERKHRALRPQKPLRLIRDGEVGWSEILCLNTYTRYTVTTRIILH